MDRLQNEILELIVEEFKARSVSERNDARVRQFEGLELRKGVLYGDAPDDIEIHQNAVRFIVSPLSGQKTGAFLDQRENYLAAAKVAYGRALDCFTFNGGVGPSLGWVSVNGGGVENFGGGVGSGRGDEQIKVRGE